MDWEILIPAVNPISNVMMGLMPQMNREEDTILEVVQHIVKKAYEIDYKHKKIIKNNLIE